MKQVKRDTYMYISGYICTLYLSRTVWYLSLYMYTIKMPDLLMVMYISGYDFITTILVKWQELDIISFSSANKQWNKGYKSTNH